MATKKHQKQSGGENFADLIGDINPIHSDQVEIYRPKRSPIPNETLKDNEKVMEQLRVGDINPLQIQMDDTLSFCRPGIQKKTFRKLKKGQYSIEAELDLHGLNTVQAQHALSNFVALMQSKNIRCIRIIHGKGLRSNNQGPVIKPLVNQWLQQHEEVLAFCSARPTDGGTGAVYVLLKLART